MPNIEGLTPLQVLTKYVADTNVIGKLIPKHVLMSDNKEIISENIPLTWMKYIKSAVNIYEPDNLFVKKKISQSRKTICTFKITGEPVPMSIGKTIVYDADSGNYSLTTGKDYRNRISKVMKIKPEVRYLVGKKPIDFPVSIQCQFYLKEQSVKFHLPEIISATLDLCVRLGILKTATLNVVESIDGSEVKYILGEPYTQVTIRRVAD